jgi:hypothetical protein
MPAGGLAGLVVERVTGIEPALSAWEADVLPLNYTRVAAPVEGRPLGHVTGSGGLAGTAKR